MKIQIKKALILISSVVVLFTSVFFITQSLNNLINATNKEDITKVEKNTSKKVTDNENNLEQNAGENTKNDNNETKTTTNSSVEKYTAYTVKQGDTLYSIARKNMPWKSQEEATKILETMNSLKDREVLSVGSHLMIPVNNIDTKDCAKYIVAKGDSLYSIAEHYMPNTNPDDAVKLIMDKNGLSNSSSLSIGLEIYIPNN